MSHELYRKHRPKRFKDVIGQDDAVDALQQFVKDKKVPHALMLSGPSGCGKTTLARILQAKLECDKSDFFEMNCSDVGGIDNIRSIRSRMMLSPSGGKCRIYYVDESHGLTSQAQDALLKMLEDTPNHVYFILSTTDPGKLKKTIRTRCTEIRVQAMSPKDMETLICQVLEKEEVKLSDEVIEKLVEVADGSARKALVILNQIYKLKTQEKQIDGIVKNDSQRQAIELCRALLRKAKWAEVAELIQTIDEEPESMRRMILGYMNSCLLKGGKIGDRAFMAIQIMRDHWYDCGKAGLTACCYELTITK